MSERSDIVLSFIRTLSVNGLVLGGALSDADRRERIRIAIFQQRLDTEPFGEGLTFSQAYRVCYGMPLELRRVPRGEDNLPIDALQFESEEEEEDQEHDDMTEAEGRLFKTAS